MTCDLPEFYTWSEPVARKRHKCCECDALILPGEKHFACRGKWEGRLDGFRQHLLCAEACMLIRDEFQDGECIGFGELRSWVGEWQREIQGNKTTEPTRRLRGLLARIRRRERKGA